MSEPIQTDSREKRFLDYPFGVSGTGAPDTTTSEDHLRDLILQVLFTIPGERVNLPEFGAGVQRLLFEPNSDALRASARFLISTNLQRWLGERITVDQVEVTGTEHEVTIEIAYTLKATQESSRLEVKV